MSSVTRDWVANHPNLFFQLESQKTDLLDENITRTELIALLEDLLKKGHIIVITCVKSDHHDDSDLGYHCHYNGFCFDGWPLNSRDATDYCDVDSPKMIAFLKDIGADPFHYQTGLTPDAYTHADVIAAGSGVFEDDGGSHCHAGANG